MAEGRQTTPDARLCPSTVQVSGYERYGVQSVTCQQVAGHPGSHFWTLTLRWDDVTVTSPARTATSCVAPDCTYSAADGSAYCALHGVKWGRGGCVHAWTALRSVPPSWRCAYCGEVTEVRP